MHQKKHKQRQTSHKRGEGALKGGDEMGNGPAGKQGGVMDSHNNGGREPAIRS